MTIREQLEEAQKLLAIWSNLFRLNVPALGFSTKLQKAKFNFLAQNFGLELNSPQIANLNTSVSLESTSVLNNQFLRGFLPLLTKFAGFFVTHTVNQFTTLINLENDLLKKIDKAAYNIKEIFKQIGGDPLKLYRLFRKHFQHPKKVALENAKSKTFKDFQENGQHHQIKGATEAKAFILGVLAFTQHIFATAKLAPCLTSSRYHNTMKKNSSRKMLQIIERKNTGSISLLRSGKFNLTSSQQLFVKKYVKTWRLVIQDNTYYGDNDMYQLWNGAQNEFVLPNDTIEEIKRINLKFINQNLTTMWIGNHISQDMSPKN